MGETVAQPGGRDPGGEVRQNTGVAKRGGGGARVQGRQGKDEEKNTSNQQQLKRPSTQIQQRHLLKESARLKRVLGQSSNLKFFL